MTAATREDVREALIAAWSRTDALFGLLHDEAWEERPIPLRHPFVFYLGHLPAFAFNQIGRGAQGRASFAPEFDELFERGIDPLGADEAEAAARDSWPERDAILAYRDRVRAFVLGEGLEAADDLETHHLVLEHELMHHETLLYMVQELDPGKKEPLAPERRVAIKTPTSVPEGRVTIPAGRTVLGADPGRAPFLWDIERPATPVDVPAFSIDVVPVTNARFLAFVEGGGYDDAALWSEEDERWLAHRGPRRPAAWSRDEKGRFTIRTVNGPVPFDEGADWPVQVSHAEAAAFARWSKARLPTEAELHRAAHGTPKGEERRHPWGEMPPVDQGAFDFDAVTPVPVGSFPRGASAFGVLETVGNGWEWTATVFAPLPGFRPTAPTYAGYSADFFDDRHVVVFGASWATDARLLRKSFRNWYQRHYPYPFTKFRLAHEPD